jgi:protein SCO1
MKSLTSFLLAFVLLAGFGARYTHAQSARDENEAALIEHLGDTIPLGLTFMNEKGEKVQLKNIIDKPTILTLVYFDCPGLCSPLLDGVSDVIENMGLELGKEYQVLTVSFNYNDTPEKAVAKKSTFLRRHSKDHAKDWIYLTGDSTNDYALANAVGFKFKKVGNDYIHPGVITILSPQGKITRYLYGVQFLPFDVKMALMEAQKGLPRPTINRVLEYCFSYDPEGRKYTLQVTKISATVIIFLAAVLLIFLLIRSNKRKEPKQTQP